ncbi:metallophosphoesterase family protein [Paracoccus seriniphilus]|uniref:metallophosphoesterase family protein n=1 Tax=Paracoccus seriniphilus TaxID=184748 RepID=UPI00356B30D1
MTKILHTADIHLDSPLRSLAMRDEGLREVVRTATRTAFTRIVDAALSHEVAALLISGDLFDGAERSAKTGAFLTGQLDRLREAGIAVFYIKGNHDAENPITGEVKLPENVHVFDGRGGKKRLGDRDIWIHGVSFSGRHAPDSLLPKFHAPEPDAINIAMMHTSLAGAEGHDTYAPCALADLTAAGFDYWALGHVHKRQIHSSAPWVVMPGIPQGRDIGEAGPKSATLLHLSDGGITIEEIPTSAAEFLEHRLDVSPCSGDDELRSHLRATLQDIAGRLNSDAGLLRLRLTGRSERRWQILRDADQWAETARDMAAETGAIWLDKISFDLDPTEEGTDTASAVNELAALMNDIRSEPGFAAEITATLSAMLSELPAHRRAHVAADEATAERLGQELAGDGALHVIAAMRGASE